MNLCQDKAEVHIRYRGGETKCVTANKGGEFFDQRPFFDFSCTLDNIFFVSLPYYMYPTLTVQHLQKKSGKSGRTMSHTG